MRNLVLEAAKCQSLTDAIRAVCPLDGISIGSWDDRKTWSIQFRPEASEKQKAEGLGVLQSLNLDDVTAAPTLEERVAQLEVDSRAVKP
jgi:hypothetical protein